ncbi:MAG: DUF1501 domain-containing protein [Pirellulaceae bacterium]|nr:DUF1501 domain-containing protein [Pirellulaceae bacterium]
MTPDSPNSCSPSVSRRQFLEECGIGLGSIALASQVGHDAQATEASINPMAPKLAHFAARAKHVIYLFMMGGPSQLDLFDYKPALNKYHDHPIPMSYIEGARFEQIREKQPKILGSPYKFKQYGETGTFLSDRLPFMQDVVDELAFVRTIRTYETVHPLAQLFLLTGLKTAGRPSLGSWVTYGLGSESEDLPGFVSLVHGAVPQAHDGLISNGFLSSSYHGVALRNQGTPILNLQRPAGINAADEQQIIQAINTLNAARFKRSQDPEISARMAAYELAFKMQSSAPDLIDLEDETQTTLDSYGVEPGKASFARDCLLARRMVERGVRFVQLSMGDWDHHGSIFRDLPPLCQQMDQPVAALLKDLKQRGLLEDTLVVWGGEFGRTPVAQPQMNAAIGRDHHVHSFTMWFAGGGAKAGANVGATDELGFHAVENEVQVQDVQATILHLLGLDHEQLTYRFQGRDFRLTDVHGHVIDGIFS